MAYQKCPNISKIVKTPAGIFVYDLYLCSVIWHMRRKDRMNLGNFALPAILPTSICSAVLISNHNKQ